MRGPGVMEKCTFCIQRIRRGAKKAPTSKGVPSPTAKSTRPASQACPTNALVFGDKYDEESRVAKMIPNERQFKLLEHLGTEPAVYYLKGGETHVGE